jgi:exopolyphosphatase/guanosine-5'-triphosphate,3'-diphosphate pyrophosphatase
MRIASIDIGTNTILMLVADTLQSGGLKRVHDEQSVARIGKSVDSRKFIHDDAFIRCRDILLRYKETAVRLGTESIIATGTSALRDASNRAEFIDRMLKETGIHIDVLSGNDEARLTYLGAVSNVPVVSDRYAVIDIGGGSTEVIVGDGHSPESAVSKDIGCVRLTERFLHSRPPTTDECEALRNHVRDALASYPGFEPGTPVIAVAGTATTLAAVDLGLTEYDWLAVSGHHLRYERIHDFGLSFSSMLPEELTTALSVDPGRADIILAGVLILDEFMRARKIDHVIVSDLGLRYGAALERFSSQ